MIMNFLKNMLHGGIILLVVYYFIGVIIVGSIANSFSIYLEPPYGVILSVITAVFLVGLISKIGGILAFAIGLIIPGICFFLYIGALMGIVSGSFIDFSDDAFSAIYPDKATTGTHFSSVQKACEEDQYCNFAEITSETRALFLRDVYINGICDPYPYATCEPEINRASVTGAVMSRDIRENFSIVKGVLYQPFLADTQSVYVMLKNQPSQPKTLAEKICVFVKGRYPGVDIDTIMINFDENTIKRHC